MLTQRSLMGLVVASVCLSMLPAAARADGAFRTVLVIDASSSMRRTDPGELRKVAAELFVDLARSGDAIAVTGFDENARQSSGDFIVIDGPESRERIKASIRAIGNDGEWTDFTSGLGEARALLERAPRKPGDQELIVFLTDGRCEPNPEGPLGQGIASRTERETLCQERMLNDIAPSLRGARVYAMGLSRNAPAAFLEEFGRRTGGQGVVTLDPRELPALFAGVYSRLLGSRLVQGELGGATSFEVYDGVKTLDLVIVGRTDRTGVLKDAAGQVIAIDNREPASIYFVASKEYRFYKIRDPRPGAWTIEPSGKAEESFATLQHFDLRLELLDVPAAIERGEALTVRARLALPGGGMPPMDFIARHTMHALITATDGDRKDPASETTLELVRGDDGTFAARFEPKELGVYGIGLVLEPGSEGVLSRKTEELARVTVAPPVHLVARAVDFGTIKHGQSASASLSLEGSQVGVPLELGLQLVDRGTPASMEAAEPPRPGGLLLTPATLALEAGKETSFALSLAVRPEARAGRQELTLLVIPISPKGFGNRTIAVPVTVEVVPLSFWERYGTMIQYGSAALLGILILLGLIMPARFPARAILCYADTRDPEMIRKSSYPLGAKAKRGFYRGARIALGPTGPVKKGGAVVLFARSGNAILAVPQAGSAVVRKATLPADDEEDFAAALGSELATEDRPRVPLSDKDRDRGFRMAAGVGYEIEGSGLVFWYK